MNADYEKLCTAVGEIDADAENYLRNDAIKIIRLGDFYRDEILTLENIFTWVNTPQGHTYWSNINKQLKGKFQ